MANTANSQTTTRESIADGVGKLSDAGHEIVLTGVGLVTLGAEGVQRLWRQREIVLEKAQARGVEVEEDAIAFARQVQEQFAEGVDKVQSMHNDRVSPRALVNRLAYKLKDKVERKLERHGVKQSEPDYQEIEIFVADESSADHPTELTAVSPAVSEEVTTPLPNYDSLTAKEIITACATLSFSELEALHEYEQKNKQRKTILQAVERKLASYV